MRPRAHRAMSGLVRSRLRPLGIVLALGLVVALVWRSLPAPSAAPPVEPRAEHDIDAGDAGAAVELVVAPVPEVPALPPTAMALTPRARPRADPCASEEEPSAIERPAIGHVLSLRESELIARARALDEGTSEALRAGLEALFAASSPEGAERAEEALSRLASAPDRHRDGFDHASAGALHLGLVALARGDSTRASAWAGRASRIARTDPAGPTLSALVAMHAADAVGVRDALQEAHARDPAEPSVALALASRLARGPRLGEASAAYDAYLAEYPEDAAIGRIAARVSALSRELEGGARARARGVTVWSAPGAGSDALRARVLDVVSGALVEAARLTGTTRAEELLVVVHRTREDMQRATCAPTWSGALYDGILHVDAQTASEPRSAERVLRHESVHAQLHAFREGMAERDVPLWLDEGVAQLFAGEESEAHRRSWALMVRERTWIPFASLDDSFVVIEDARDAGLAYHQSLAMVLYLSERPRALRDAFAYLDGGGSRAELLAHAAPELDPAALLAFLAAR